MESTSDRTSTNQQPGTRDYVELSLLLAVFALVLVLVRQMGADQSVAAVALRGPLLVLVGLTGLVGVLMIAVRNGTILRGLTRVDYYVDYQSAPPPEWIERPARTFNNLLQLPVLFYVFCLVAMQGG